MMIRVYFDACAINRVTDTNSQLRVREEAEVMRAVLERVRDGRLLWVSSSVLEEELSRIPDGKRRSEMLSMLPMAQKRVNFAASMAVQVHAAAQAGLGAFDAMHLVCAESAGCHVLLTTDDRFIKRAQRFPTSLQVLNPVDWFRGGPV